MSDDNCKSAWPPLPRPGTCNVRVLVQDAAGLTSEVSLPCVDWEAATREQERIRAALAMPRGEAESLAASPLSVERFSEMNRRRCESVHGFGESLQPDSKYTLLAWACSIASEAGEVCDAVVGYEGLKKRRAGKTRDDIADELADVITYADLAIQKLGLWTPDVLVKKFNAVNARLEDKDPHCGAVKRFALANPGLRRP